MIESTYREWKERITAKEHRLLHLQQSIHEREVDREQMVELQKLLEEVRVFLQQLAEATRDELMRGLQTVVTLCLQHVFGPHLRFEIEIGTIRNNTAIEFYVVNEDGDLPVRLKPEDAMGGGLIDTVSIGLRFGLLKILNPAPIGPMFLDEPAKMVSADKVDYIGHLLKELSKMFDKQVFLVTHHTQLMDIADRGFYVRQEKGISICEG